MAPDVGCRNDQAEEFVGFFDLKIKKLADLFYSDVSVFGRCLDAADPSRIRSSSGNRHERLKSAFAVLLPNHPRCIRRMEHGALRRHGKS